MVVRRGELPLSLPAFNWCSAPARVTMEIYREAVSWILYRRISESTQVQGRSVVRRLIHSVEESSEAEKRVASRVTFARAACIPYRRPRLTPAFHLRELVGLVPPASITGSLSINGEGTIPCRAIWSPIFRTARPLFLSTTNCPSSSSTSIL
jgi:hypothetical protein